MRFSRCFPWKMLWKREIFLHKAIRLFQKSLKPRHLFFVCSFFSLLENNYHLCNSLLKYIQRLWRYCTFNITTHKIYPQSHFLYIFLLLYIIGCLKENCIFSIWFLAISSSLTSVVFIYFLIWNHLKIRYLNKFSLATMVKI